MIFFKRIFQFIIFLLLYPIIALLRYSPLRIAEKIASKITRFFGPKLRTQNIVMENLDIIFPKKSFDEKYAISLKMWKHLGINLAHALQMDNAQLFKRTKIVGQNHFDTAYAKGKGVIILSAHLGVWDVVCISIRHITGVGTDTIYRPIENPFLNTWFKRFREKEYNRLILKGPNAGKAMISGLRKGHVLPMMSDQKMWDGIEVDFFEKPALSAPGAVVIGHKLKSCVVPAFAIYDGKDFVLTFEPEMQLTGDAQQDTRAMNAIFEKWIVQYPEQYFTLTHKRWRD